MPEWEQIRSRHVGSSSASAASTGTDCGVRMGSCCATVPLFMSVAGVAVEDSGVMNDLLDW